MKKVFCTIAALIAVSASAIALSSCNKGAKPSSSAGDTIRIEAPDDELSFNSVKHVVDAKVINLTTKEYCAKVAAMDAPYSYLGTETAIVDFWATWCGPCRELAPVLEQLSAETGVTIYKVDVDQSGDLAQIYNIQYIPQLYYCKDGKITPIENRDDNYSLGSLKKLVGK